MASNELKELLFRVISSWQVIVVTVALVLFFLLFFYAARPHQRKKPPVYSPTGETAPAPVQQGAPPTEVSDDDELGIEGVQE